MNDEKRPQPLMTDLLLSEEHLSRLYQETATAMPPPGLDAAILDAAHQATRQQPRRVYFLTARKWTMTLALAAALIMTIGIVRTLRHEMTSPALVAPTPAAPRSSSTARGDGRDETLLKRHEQKQEQEKEAPAVAHQPVETLGETVGPDTKDRFSLPEPQKEEGVASSLQAAGTAFPSAPERRRKMKAEGAKKDALSPDELSLDEWSLDEWIAEIKKLRQAGKMVEAEANLTAFKQRYPAYPVEKALALPHKSHNEQKGAR